MASSEGGSSTERLQEWKDRWETGSTAFHRQDAHHVLREYLTELIEDGSATRVVVPLCGKTEDMPYLASQTSSLVSEVVGVEGIRKAVEEFASEHPDMKISFSGDVASSEDGRLKVYVSDFFELPDIGKFGAAWDRGSFLAISEDLRQTYADTMSSLMQPGGRILLDVFLYDQNEMQGPPFSIDVGIIEKHFGSTFTIKKLASTDAAETHKELMKRLSACSEDVYLLTRR